MKNRTTLNTDGARREKTDSAEQKDGTWPETQWSQVLLAAKHQDHASGIRALDDLCVAYVSPINAFIRMFGYSEQDAEDLGQSFVESLLTKDKLKQVDPERGKFRTFICAALKNFLRDQWRHKNRQKRSGEHVSSDGEDFEAVFGRLWAARPAPDEYFDREWALTVLKKAKTKLAKEVGDSAAYEALEPYLLKGIPQGFYNELAEKLSLTEVALRQQSHRIKAKFKTLLMQCIKDTLSDAGEVEAEYRYLVNALTFQVKQAGSTVLRH